VCRDQKNSNQNATRPEREDAKEMGWRKDVSAADKPPSLVKNLSSNPLKTVRDQIRVL